MTREEYEEYSKAVHEREDADARGGVESSTQQSEQQQQQQQEQQQQQKEYDRIYTFWGDVVPIALISRFGECSLLPKNP